MLYPSYRFQSRPSLEDGFRRSLAKTSPWVVDVLRSIVDFGTFLAFAIVTYLKCYAGGRSPKKLCHLMRGQNNPLQLQKTFFN